MAGLLTRDDTLLGACLALGEDFGFDPVWLRLVFALGLFVSPLTAVGAYAGCGLVVAVSRWLVPEPRPDPVPAESPPAADDERQAQAWEELALAA